MLLGVDGRVRLLHFIQRVQILEATKILVCVGIELGDLDVVLSLWFVILLVL